MGRIVSIVRPFGQGFGSLDIAPGRAEQVVLELRKVSVVTRLMFTPRCQDLMILSVLAGPHLVLENVPCANYIEPFLDREDADLVNDIRQCFRYQDHTLEEYLKVIRLLRPKDLGREVRWPSVPLGERVVIVLYNPTKAPVLAMGMIEGKETVSSV